MNQIDADEPRIKEALATFVREVGAEGATVFLKMEKGVIFITDGNAPPPSTVHALVVLLGTIPGGEELNG